MDHAEAHVLQFSDDEVERARITASHGRQHIHHRRGAIGDGRAPEDHQFFSQVAETLAGAQRILLTGPASAKDEFRKYLETHPKGIAARIAAVQKADHPSEGELLKMGRAFFLRDDNMHRSPRGDS